MLICLIIWVNVAIHSDSAQIFLLLDSFKLWMPFFFICVFASQCYAKVKSQTCFFSRAKLQIVWSHYCFDVDLPHFRMDVFYTVEPDEFHVSEICVLVQGFLALIERITA